ncbi:MAG: choice-of-anchor J domain-containing protein [Marinoscillum sp.]
MKLLNKFLAFTLGIAALYSCNPLEDTYEELDAMTAEQGVDAGVSLNYTLIEDDYSRIASDFEAKKTLEDSMKADFLDQYHAFNTSMAVSDILEDLINDNYPQFRKGAAVRVTYNMLDGETFEDPSSEYVNSLYYRLDADDYASVSAEAGSYEFFDSETSTMSSVASVLGMSIQDPANGDVVSASFQTVDVAYSSLTGEVMFSDDFATSIDSFTKFDLEGDQSWGHDESFGSTYAIMSGFSGGALANRDWLVSGEIDLTGKSGTITMSLSQILNFQGGAEWGTHLRIVYATDYSGDVATANWTDISFDELPVGNNWDVFDNTADISDAAGEKIHLGFYYESTTSDAPNWRIVNVVIEAGAAPETNTENVLYRYDGGSWESLEDEAYYLGSADYNAMGAPGRFDNFSESDAPENYLPAFLQSRFPFAQEGDEYVLVYRYYNGSSTSTRGNLYVYSSGSWSPTMSEDQIKEVTDQYVHTGSKFVFNPSVALKMTSSDFQIIVDEVFKTRPELVNSFGTGEDLYGSDAFYSNFDLRLSSRKELGDDNQPLQPEYSGLSDTEGKALIQERLVEGIDLFLETKFATMNPIDGIEILYTVNYVYFDGANGEGTKVYVLTGPGTFEIKSEE